MQAHGRKRGPIGKGGGDRGTSQNFGLSELPGPSLYPGQVYTGYVHGWKEGSSLTRRIPCFAGSADCRGINGSVQVMHVEL